MRYEFGGLIFGGAYFRNFTVYHSQNRIILLYVPEFTSFTFLFKLSSTTAAKGTYFRFNETITFLTVRLCNDTRIKGILTQRNQHKTNLTCTHQIGLLPMYGSS